MTNVRGDNTIWYGGPILTADGLREDVEVVVTDGVIQEVRPAGDARTFAGRRMDLAGHYLVPGFIDVQVNGGGGVLFNNEPTVEGARAIAKAHRAYGTTGLLPTLISDDMDVVEAGLTAIDTAIESGVPGILGIHLEGPFLNPEKRGIHEISRIRHLTASALDELRPLNNGITVITVAPDAVDAGMIRQLTHRGFLVCAGHSDASNAQVREALGQGLRGFTHLYNAMSQLTAREPGMVGTALADADSWCGIIADGIHLSDESLRIAYRCKGPEKLMLVTDAMPPVGSDQDGFQLQGKQITVENKLCSYSDGTLAGSALDMATAIRYAHHHIPCRFEQAVGMASTTPANFLGLQGRKGRIAPGQDADLCVLDRHLQVLETVIGGQTG